MFNRLTLVDSLRGVHATFRCLFAACCAERLKPALEAFTKQTQIVDYAEVDAALANLWNVVQADDWNELEISRSMDRCKSDTGRVEKLGTGPLALAAADAIACVGYGLISARSQKAEDAAWAGTRAIDTFFQYITQYLSTSKTLDKNTLSKAFAHPLYIAELDRQQRDVNDLKKISPQNAQELIQTLQVRNEIDGHAILRVLTSPPVRSEL